MKIGIITYAVDLAALAKKAEELGFEFVMGAGTQTRCRFTSPQ